MRLLDVLRREQIVVPLEASSVHGAVVELVDRLVATGAIDRPERLEKLVKDERIRSVAHVGDSVVLPHLRTDAVGRLVVAVGVAPHPLQGRQGEESGARIVVLVLAPPDAASHYLQTVAALARVLRQDATVTAISAAATADDVLEVPQIRDLSVQPTLAVRDVMTHQVLRVYPDAPVRELLDLMRRHQLKLVPVVGRKRELLGVVTEGDILRHLLPTIATAGESGTTAENEALLTTPAREIMSRSVMCISEDQSLSEVVSTMINKNVERLPVVQEGQLTGFLTRADVIRKLFAS